ncbi:hypothetical protein Tco_0899336 [Tanacetum coccineum]
MHEDFVASVYPQVHESLKHPNEEHVHLENPLNSSETLSSMKNLDDAFTYGDQFLNDKPTEEQQDKVNVETEVESMVTVRFHQASSSAPPLSTPVILISSPKTNISSYPRTTARVTTLEQICANFEKKNKVQDQTAQALSSRIFMVENHDLYSKIDKYINENVKEVVQDALKAPPEYTALYEAMEVSLDRENREEFMDVTTKSRKRRRDDQDPPTPPPKDSEQNDMHLSDSEDTNVDHLPKIKTRPDWLKPIPKEEMPKTPEPDWVIPPNDLPELENNWANAIAKSYQDLEENKLLQKTRDMGFFIKWYYKQIRNSKVIKVDLEDKIDLANPEGNRVVLDVSKPLPLGGLQVRSYMKILSVVSLKTYSRYGYTYLKEIVLQRADYNEYKISESNFKNLHPNDFEDMYLLHLQGKLNHLYGSDKVNLFNAFNLWIRNIIIRKCVKDLQLGIESYQTKLNLTKLNMNNQKKMMKETEMHKFSDGTLTRILEKLDYLVKDFRLFKYNLGMENRIWSEDDKRWSKEFIEVIERRLKIRRIFRSLESFVSGRLRDVDYRLIQRK